MHHPPPSHIGVSGVVLGLGVAVYRDLPSHVYALSTGANFALVTATFLGKVLLPVTVIYIRCKELHFMYASTYISINELWRTSFIYDSLCLIMYYTANLFQVSDISFCGH